MQIIIIFLLLLTSTLRVEVSPRTGIAPKAMEIRAYLQGDEDAIAFGLYEGGMLARSSAQTLQGEKLVHVVWRHPPTGDLTLVVVTFKEGKEREQRSIDLIYLPIVE